MHSHLDDDISVPVGGVEPADHAVQDFLTSAFLVTSKDCFYSRSEFGLVCTYMGDAADSYHLPVPTIVKPVELWTGKQIFSAMVRPNAATRCTLLRAAMCFSALCCAVTEMLSQVALWQYDGDSMPLYSLSGCPVSCGARLQVHNDLL